MTHDKLKDLKATYNLYGAMTLHPEVVNHLFDVAIAASAPKAETQPEAKVEEEAPKPRAKKSGK